MNSNYTEYFENIWRDRKLELSEVLGEKYSELIDENVRERSKKILQDIEDHIEENNLQEKFNAEHEAIRKALIKTSEDFIKTIDKEIRQYKEFSYDCKKSIEYQKNKKRLIEQILNTFSNLEYYHQYFKHESLLHDFGNKLSDRGFPFDAIKNYIDELDWKINYDFYFPRFWQESRSAIAEIEAINYFKKLDYTLQSATPKKSSGLDLHVENRTQDFYVEVYCPIVPKEWFDSLKKKDVLQTSGAGFIPSDDIAFLLRRPIENKKDACKTAQITKFANSYQGKKIYLWIDLSNYMNLTKVIYSWKSDFPADGLSKVLYNHNCVSNFSYNLPKKGIKEDQFFLEQNKNQDVCCFLRGVIFHHNKETMYVHNPKVGFENPLADFPNCSRYCFLYKDRYYKIRREELKWPPKRNS